MDEAFVKFIENYAPTNYNYKWTCELIIILFMFPENNNGET